MRYIISDGLIFNQNEILGTLKGEWVAGTMDNYHKKS